MSVKLFIKSGAVISSLGAAMLAIISIVLLTYPIINDCHYRKCTLASAAPNPLNELVKPNILALSIGVVAVGVAIIRFGTWYQLRSRLKADGI